MAKVLIEASQRHYNTVRPPRQPRLPPARPGSGFFTLTTDAGQLTRADALFLYQLQLGKFPEGTIPLAEDRELSAVLAKWLATDCLRVRFGTSSMLSLAPTWAMPAPIGSPTQHVPGWPSWSTAGVGGITMFGGRRWQAAGMV